MAVVYYINNEEVKVENCDLEDIDVHYELLRELVVDTDESEYKENMVEAVKQGYAMKVGNEAFLYVHKWRNTWFGDSIYSKDMIKLGLVFKELTDLTGEVNLKFNPHEGLLKTMKSLATRESIRSKHNGQNYVTVKVSDVKKKFIKLLERFGV